MAQYTHEILSTDNTITPLSAYDHNRLVEAMRAGDQFFPLNIDTIFNIPKDIKKVRKRVTQQAGTPVNRQIMSGNLKPIDREGPGYKKFIEAREKLKRKKGLR